MKKTVRVKMTMAMIKSITKTTARTVEREMQPALVAVGEVVWDNVAQELMSVSEREREREG